MNSMSKNIIYKAMLNIFNICIPLIIGPYALRVIGGDIMGEIFYGESVFGYFLIFSSFGLYQYGIRELSSVRDNEKRLREKFTSLFIISISASIVTLVGLFLYIKFGVTNSMQITILTILSVNIVANILYVEWAIEALENYKFITIKTIIVKTIYILLLVLLVKSPENYKVYLVLLVGSSLINNAISFIFITKKIKFRFKNIHIWVHILPLIVVILMSNANTLFTQLDRIFLGQIGVSKTVVSYYTLPQSITAAINGLLQSILIVTIPRLSKIASSGNIDEYERLLSNNNKLYFTIFIPVVFGLFAVADKVILLYGGSEFAPSIITMRLFCIYLLSLGIEYIITNQVLYAQREEKMIFIFLLTSGICNLVFKSILLKMRILTPNTAILSTTMSNVIYIVLETIYIKRKLNMTVNIISTYAVKCALFCLSFIGIAIIINSYIKGILMSTFLIVAISVGVYYIFLLKNNKEFINFLVDKLKLKRS